MSILATCDDPSERCDCCSGNWLTHQIRFLPERKTFVYEVKSDGCSPICAYITYYYDPFTQKSSAKSWRDLKLPSEIQKQLFSQITTLESAFLSPRKSESSG